MKINEKNYGAFGDGKLRFTYPQTAPPETLANLKTLFARNNIEIEIAIMQGEREVKTKEQKTIKDWVLHTPSKRKFTLHIIRATMDNCHMTVPELVTLGVAERQTILGYIKECEDAGWIKVCREENKNKITANPILIGGYVDYSEWLLDTYYTAELSYLVSTIKYLTSLNDAASSVTSHDT